MKTLVTLFLIAVFAAGLFPLNAGAAATRNCGKEMEADYKKYKKDMVRLGFSKRVNTIKNPNVVTFMERRHDEVVKHEEAHAKTAGKWGKKIIYRKIEYWGEKYAVAGCVPFKKLIPAKIAAASALAPDLPSDQDLRIAKYAKQAIKYEKDYRKVKAASKKCVKIFTSSKKAKCKKAYRKRLARHPFLAVKSLYTW